VPNGYLTRLRARIDTSPYDIVLGAVEPVPQYMLARRIAANIAKLPNCRGKSSAGITGGIVAKNAGPKPMRGEGAVAGHRASPHIPSKRRVASGPKAFWNRAGHFSPPDPPKRPTEG
jgi:hypothetical protein